MKFVLSALLLVLPFTAFSAEKIIGVGMVLKQVDQKTYVESLVTNAPAQRDGSIHEGDQIISVKQMGDESATWTPVEQLPMEEIVGMIRGPEGSQVALHLGNDKGQYEVVLTREPIDIP